MNQVTLVEFRKNAEGILRRVRQGERIVLTYRGRPAARLEPVQEVPLDGDDPIYRLADLARSGGRTLSNKEIDAIIYGS
jgi:prevent-host-death family protein